MNSIETSAPPATGTGNPIHVVSGNKYQLETDHPALPGPLGLVWQRHYNSQSDDHAELGAGWRHSYDVQARPTADGFRVVQADGRHILFTAAADGRYESTLHSDGWLTQTADPTYGNEERVTWHWLNGQQLKFNARGQLTDIIAPSGAAVRLQYNDQQRLFLVRDAQNRELSLSYYPNGRLRTVLDTTGQPLRYRYDDRGNLVSVTYPDNTTRQYHYDDAYDANNLTGITDQLGIRFATWSYDDQDRAISSEHADGVEKVTIDFSDDGTRLITNSLGEVSTYYTEQRNGLGIVIAIAGPGCSSCSMGDVQYDYNEQLQLVATTYASGVTNYQDYDHQNRLVTLRQTNSAGDESLIRRFIYADDAAIRPTQIVLPSINPDDFHKLNIAYNTDGQPISVTEMGFAPRPGDSKEFVKLSRTSTIQYDKGKIVLIDGPRTDVDDHIALQYDTQSRLSSLRGPDGRSLSVLSYDRYGRPTQLQQAQQSPFKIRYNVRGEITSIAQQDQRITYEYDAAGRLIRTRESDGSVIDIVYDAAGRKTSLRSNTGQFIELELDSESRMQSSRIADNGVLKIATYFYDAKGRLAATHPQGGQSSQYHYDEYGDLVNVENASGHSETLAYGNPTSDLGTGMLGKLRLIQSVDTKPTANAGHSARLSGYSDKRSNDTDYLQDDFGQVRSIISADTGWTNYEYDAAGNVIAETNAEGQRTEYTYDAANQVTRWSTTSNTTTITYDPASGNPATIINDDTTETFAYNERGQTIRHTRRIDSHEFTTRYTYNKAGQLSQERLPDGQDLTYHYYQDGDQKGRLRAIMRNNLFFSSTVIGEIRTEANGDLSYVHGNGVRSCCISDYFTANFSN